MRECRRVHDDAAHQGRGHRAIVDVERHAKANGQERDHLACGGGPRVDPVGVTRGIVRGVMVDHDARQPFEELRVAYADLADPLE